MRYVVGCVVGLSLLCASTAAAQSLDPQIRTLSNRADLISGGDALAELVLPAGVDPAQVHVDVDGRDVTPAFAVRPDGRDLGLLTGLRNGQNVVTARGPGGTGSSLAVVNHPIGGPGIAGPQIQPWTCFDGALDKQCNRAPSYDYFYKSTSGGDLKAYDPANPPSDVATTTTDQGKTVPFIVRQETGEIDRDEYHIAVLFDPSKPWVAVAPQD